MQYVHLAVPQELYKSLGFCPEMALLPSSDMKSIKIVPFSSISQFQSSSDSSLSRINIDKNSSPLECFGKGASASFVEKSDIFAENASTSELDSNDQTGLCSDKSKEGEVTSDIGVEKVVENGVAPHIAMECCPNPLPDHGYQKNERDSVVEVSNCSGDQERPKKIILNSSKTVSEPVNIPGSISSLSQGGGSADNTVSWEVSTIDGNNGPESPLSGDDSDSATEDPLHPQHFARVDHLLSDCQRFLSKKKALKAQDKDITVPFKKVCDNCCRTYKAIKTFQRHKKNCEKYKAMLVSGRVRKERGSCNMSVNDIVSDIPKGSKTVNHMIWKNGPRVDITCDKCHWKFFSLHRYERHLTQCKVLQARRTDILDNSIEKEKSVKWIHAPAESSKKAQQYFVLRK